MKFGYARVSTKEQNLDLQIDALKKAGCQEIFHEVGGKEFTTIPCLNDRDDWVKVLSRWVDEWAHQ